MARVVDDLYPPLGPTVAIYVGAPHHARITEVVPGVEGLVEIALFVLVPPLLSTFLGLAAVYATAWRIKDVDAIRDPEPVSIAYPLTDGSGEIVVATVRPETMLGDTGVAVSPDDERFRGADSMQLLRAVAEAVAAEGWRLDNVDAVVADGQVDIAHAGLLGADEVGAGAVFLPGFANVSAFVAGVRIVKYGNPRDRPSANSAPSSPSAASVST